MLSVATLSVEAQMMNPPKPHGIVVMVDGRPIAVVTLDDFDKAVAILALMRDKHKQRQ